MNKKVIECIKVYKKYPLYKRDAERLRGLIFSNYKPEEFDALQDINLSIFRGEIVGLIGLNGSGKSTLATIIAGIIYPSSGQVIVDGDVNMLSASAGMEEYLTGRENIEFKGLLLGLSRIEIKKLEDKIIDFADIGIHIDQPLRTYSSGMRARLGFSISVHMEPEILIIDEALSVGDGSFVEKSLAKFQEFKERGKTIIYVSHSVTQMSNFCDRIVWLHKGRIIASELPENIIRPYCGFAREFNSMNFEERLALNPRLEEYQKKYL